MKILILLATFVLLSCGGNTIIQTKEVAVLPPKHLISDPCKPTESGTTVRSLAAGYIHNTDCVSKFATKLEDLRSWTEAQEKLYKDNKKD